jgi:2-polyprenyl-3-methyl-5-hydroxy-6-metoxy-1,4-benzoquinol methylase
MKSRAPEYFEQIYAKNPDPWNFARSRYEHEKYHETLAMLEDQHFASGLEIGCSIGILTGLLAGRCHKLLAVDIVDTALSAARANCADFPQVRFEKRQMPAQWPERERFDLVVLSEVLYFLTQEDIAELAAHVADSLLPGGVVLLVNFLGEIDEPSGGGDAAAEAFLRPGHFDVMKQSRREKYRIDRLRAN